VPPRGEIPSGVPARRAHAGGGATPGGRHPAGGRHSAAEHHSAGGEAAPRARGNGFVLVRELVEPRWAPFRLGIAGGLARRRGNGLVRLLHVGGEPVVVAAAGTVFAARSRSETAAREGIARMRSACGIDDDLADFHARFRDDPVIGRAVRAYPELRVRRNVDPWETLMFSITEQLIDMPRALAIQRRMTAAYGRRFDGLRDAPSAEVIAARAPAELEACGLHAKRALAMIRCAREVAAGRVTLARAPRALSPPAGTDRDAVVASLRGDADFARLLAIPEIGTWTVEMLALHGLGRLDVIPAGDLGYLKLVGRLQTGNPRAIADEDEVRGFFSAYAPYAGLAAQYLSGSARLLPAPRRAGTRWSAGSPRTVAA
jgi:3-methyladenine DNA glycosylase/8-oxoguanine DNA glycosylase